MIDNQLFTNSFSSLFMVVRVALNTVFEAKRPFYIITAMLYLCDAVNPRNRLREDIFQLMKKYSHLPIQRMGFFAGWEQEPIWATKRDQKTWLEKIIASMFGCLPNFAPDREP